MYSVHILTRTRTHAHSYVSLFLSLFLPLSFCLSLSLYMCVCIYTYRARSLSLSLFMCVCVCVCVCIYIHEYTRIYIYIDRSRWFYVRLSHGCMKTAHILSHTHTYMVHRLAHTHTHLVPDCAWICSGLSRWRKWNTYFARTRYAHCETVLQINKTPSGSRITKSIFKKVTDILRANKVHFWNSITNQ